MNFDYNTQRKRMNLPEYGRNVQKMVDHIKTLDDREERSRAARSIIQIMGNLNPTLRDSGDVKHILWDHLAIIADFELDIESPYPPPEKEKLMAKPAIVPYKDGEVKYLHYGRIIELMIDVACKMDDGDEKGYLIILIGNQMKKASITWNRGQITDDIIGKDLVGLSENRLTLPENFKLLEAKDLIGPKKKKPPQTQKYPRQQKRKHQGKY